MIKFSFHLNKARQKISPLLIFHHAIIKREIFKKFGNKKHPFLDLLCLLGTFLLLSISLLVWTIFSIYKRLVYFYLYLQFGKKLQGVITGCDLLTILSPDCDGCIHGLVQCATKKEFDGQNLYTLVTAQIYEKFFLSDNTDPKFFSIRRYTRLGYFYYQQIEDVEINEIVKCMSASDKRPDEAITEDELMVIAERYYNSDLPVGNKFNWDLCVVLNPLITHNVKSGESKTRFVILTRMYHTLGDGLVIYNILSNNLFRMGEELDGYTKNLVEKSKDIEKRKKYTNLQMFGFRNVMQKPCLLRDGRPHLQAKFAARCEPPSSHLFLDKIKEIRNKFPGVVTSNVLMAAYSAALSEYYVKYSSSSAEIPEYIFTTHPVQLNVRRYLEMYTTNAKIQLGNEVSSFNIKIPIIPRGKEGIPIRDYLVERMLELRDSYQYTLQSFDIQATYIFTEVFFGVFPYQIVNKLFQGVSFQTLTTSLPGGPRLQLFTGDDVENLFYLLPRQSYCSLMISINTYDRRLQIGLTGDAEKFNSRRKLDEISDGLFKYIDLLYEECMKFNNVDSKK